MTEQGWETHYGIRDGDVDLKFEGRKIGEASGRRNASNRWTEVCIYETRAKHLVVCVSKQTIWEGETDRHTSVVCEDLPSVIDWLKTDNNGYLGATSKEAYEQACQALGVDSEMWVD